MTRGDKIKTYMVKYNMETKELAERLGIAQSYLYKILNDKIKSPAPEILNGMANIFGVEVEELINVDQDKIYYDEPEILSRLPKDLQEFVMKEENTPYLIVAKQLSAYDLSKLTETEMKFLVDWLKMAIKENNN